jgi:glucose/arabinose dehydrogenase
VRAVNDEQFVIAELRKSMVVHRSSMALVEQSPLFGDTLGHLLMVADTGGETADPRVSAIAVRTIADYMLNIWDPVVAPSGMTFYTGEAFPGWQGSLFIGSLRPGLLVRLTLADGQVTGEERYLGDLGERIRDVRQGPDGLLYLLTDSRDGRILRVLPAAPR